MVWWRGPTHKCLGAEVSPHLNVETELMIKWCGGGDPCINVLSAERSSHLHVETEPRRV